MGMRVCEEDLKNRSQWSSKGYRLPNYDRKTVAAKTKENPMWIHFGAGNIFRAFIANIVQELLNKGHLTKGLIVAEGFDYEIIEKMNRPCNDYSLLVTLKADGTVEKTIIGSVVESHILDTGMEKEFGRLKKIFESDTLYMATFTITEKGYNLTDAGGKWLKDVEADFEAGPDKANSYMGKVASLLYTRFKTEKRPIAMVSLDNCSHNGDRLLNAVNTFAKEWSERGLTDPKFVEYVNDKRRVTFPWTMIDKITPRPDSTVSDMLKKDGLEGLEAVVTQKNTYVAPFVNAEEAEYLVIEDSFPAGRPKLENYGIIFTDRQTVEKVEKMKVCTCLNPLHTALAVFGVLLGYKTISDEMRDARLRKLVQNIGYKEGLPVVVNPGVIEPKEFLDTVINKRIANPFMPDTPQRIATDTSQKLAVRFGETIKEYMASDKLDVKSLKFIPMVFAGWLRYMMGIDDEGKYFELSPDPLTDVVKQHILDVKLGDDINIEEKISRLLRNKEIFGVDLYEAGLAKSVCDYFKEMIAGVGAVSATLDKYL